MSSLLEAALGYAARGWPVFPCKPRSKKPATDHGFKDATCDEATIRAWFAPVNGATYNLAICTGSGLIVLDVDGDEGEARVAALEREHGALPPTVESLTGNGRHLLYAVSDGESVPCSTRKLGPGLDVKAYGGYIVAPPSLHPSGWLYSWSVDAHPDECAVAEGPAWLLALARRSAHERAAPDKDHRGEVGTWITPGNRNNALTSIAGKLRRVGLEAGEIGAALLAVNEGRCDPPLGEEEVRRIASSVARYAPGEADDDGPALDVVDPLALVGRQAPDRQWLVADWIPMRQVTMLGGDGGVGKSLIAQQLTTCCATGTPWLGLAVRQVKAFVLFCEDDDDEVWRRQERSNAALGVEMGDLENLAWSCPENSDTALMMFRDDVGTPTPFFWRLAGAVKESGAQLIVLDALHDLFAGNFAPSLFARRNDREGRSRQDFSVAMESLFEKGAIRVAAYGPPSNGTHKIVRVETQAASDQATLDGRS